MRGFIGIDEQPKVQEDEPVVSPVLRELVRRGVRALPDLFRHLSDPRASKRVVVNKGFGSNWHSDESHPRFPDSNRQPPGVNGDRDLHKRHNHIDKYTLRVGDLCYVAIGQIVNRSLLTVRYQPTACWVVNSPVETPALAQAAKADWDGLTAQQHEQSLYQDALSLSYPWAAPQALSRLLYYYPRTGKSLLLRLLDRPFYEDGLVSNFFEQKLVPAKEARWPELLSAFRTAQGEVNYRGLLWVLVSASTVPKSHMDEPRERSKRVADNLLTRFFPWFDPLTPPFVDAVSFARQ
jgi:hypothetical protein